MLHEDGLITGILMWDLSAAFDTIDSKIMCDKLKLYWKALKRDKKDNSFKASMPIINTNERITRSQTNGTLTIEGHSQLTQNNFINDSKIVWNHCPDEITKNSCIHPPKKLIKKFVKTLPM